MIKRNSFIVVWCSVILLGSTVFNIHALIRRHDVEDKEYLSDRANFPALATI